MKNKYINFGLRFWVSFIFMFCLFILKAQLSGRIMDAETNYPIANVIITSGKEKTKTNENGVFSINVDGWLVVRNPSYKPDSVIVSSSSSYLLLYLIPLRSVTPLRPFFQREH